MFVSSSAKRCRSTWPLSLACVIYVVVVYPSRSRYSQVRSGAFGPHETMPFGNFSGKKLLSQSGTDGIGHQLLGMYSCMLVPLLDPTWVYVQKDFTGSTGHRTSRYSKKLFEALQEEYPKVQAEYYNVRRVDNCWGDLKRFCSQDRARCDSAKRHVSAAWDKRTNEFVTKMFWLSERSRPPAIVLHLRGGDQIENLRIGLKEYPHLVKYVHTKTGINSVIILTERSRDADFLKAELSPQIKTLSPSLNINYMIGGDPVKAWLTMVRATALILGPSSFSISAAAARASKHTYTLWKKPNKGRYDDTVFPCSVNLQACEPSTCDVMTVYYDKGHGSDYC